MQGARGLQKTNMASYSNRFFCSMLPLSELFFLIIEHGLFMVLVFNEKCMLEKVTMPRTPQFERTYLNAAHA